MLVRDFNIESDYEDVSKWWEAQGWPALPKNLLNCKGFIAEENGIKLSATWMFATGCPIYIMEWTVGNPEVDWQKRSEAIQNVTDSACNWAKQDGAQSVFTMTKHEKFIKKLQDSKFIITESGMTHLVRSL